MPVVTQADVVRGTIEQISKRGGFTVDAYQHTRDRDYRKTNHPGPFVTATCAVGGVEQAIWRLTGEDVAEERYRTKTATTEQRGNLYRSVMAKLNRKTKQMFHHVMWDDDPVQTFEEITFVGSERTSRKRVLAVLHAVLEDLTK